MEYVVIKHIFSFSFAAMLTSYLVPLMQRVAAKCGMLDQPDGKIKLHSKPTPYLGGVAIYLSFIAVLALVYPFENTILWFLLGITFLLFLGLIDDLLSLKPWQKIVGQCFAVVCFLKGGFSLKEDFFSGFINIAVSGFWMLSIINSFNLVDVMDGLASLLALIAAASFFVIALALHQYTMSLLLVTFLGGVVAFFSYNKPLAKIYLGDSGAFFLGGFFAAMPLFFSWGTYALRGYLVPLFILGIPLFEVASLVIIRASKGIPFYQGSPDHFSHYLKAKGWHASSILQFTALMHFLCCFTAILFFLGFLSEIPFFILIGSLALFWTYRIFF